MVTIPQTPIKEPHVPVTVFSYSEAPYCEEYKNSTLVKCEQTRQMQ